MFEKVPQARHTLLERPDGLDFTVPAGRNLFVVLFLGFWLVGWGFGEVSAVFAIIAAPGKALDLFLLAWLGGWTLGGAFAGYQILWMLTGREVVSISGESFSLKNEVLGLGRWRNYNMAEVKNLRVAPPGNHLGSWQGRGRSRYGSIAFDYGAETIYLGSGIAEAEAGQIVGRIKARFASLAQ